MPDLADPDGVFFPRAASTMNRSTVDVTRHAPSPIWQSYDTSRNHRWFSASPGTNFLPGQSFQMPSPLQRPQQPQRLYHTATMPSTTPLLNQRSTMACSNASLVPPQAQRRANIEVMTGLPVAPRYADSPASTLQHSTQLTPPPRVVLGSSPSSTLPAPTLPPLMPTACQMKINPPIIGLSKTQIIQREVPSLQSRECLKLPRQAEISAASSLPTTPPPSTVTAFGPLLRGSRKFLLRRLDTQLDCALLVRLDPDCFVAIQCKYTDDKNILQQRCAAFVKAHNLKAELVLRGLYQKCFTMLKKRERLLAKKMASVVRLLDERQEVKEMYYSIVDIIALME